jgi:mono/diheme cytochrome c family protein
MPDLEPPSVPSPAARPRRRLRAALIAIAVCAAMLWGAGLAAIELRWTRRFEAPYPALAASGDPAVVAEGEYLVYSAAACAYCHVPREQWDALDRGAQPPLTGHHLFRLPFGDIYSSNLTPDAVTGIGGRSDGELARVLRYGVRADGRAAFPLMEFHGLSDADLVAVMSYLRSRPAVSHAVPEHSLSRFGKALMSFAITPVGPAAPPPQANAPDPSVARGDYLANTVGSCVTCHTDRGEDGQLVGQPFGGGQRMDVAASTTEVYVSPNLTPDALSSPIGVWNEDAFVARFRQGPLLPGTPMPWGAFARLRDGDLRSLYRYLRTLPPVLNRTGPAIQRRTD